MYKHFFRYQRIFSLPLAALALLALPTTRTCAQQSSATDYDNVPDILDGQRFLLQEDDLIVTAKVGNYAQNQDLLYTTNSGVVSKDSRMPRWNTGLKANASVAVAHMYKNAPPVVVYGLQGSGSNSPFLGVLSTNPNFGAYETIALAGPAKSTVRQLVVGDFNGDGLDDILAVHGDGYLTVCTAKDPNAYDLRLRCGPTHLHGDYLFQRLTAADFRGIGRAQLAWAYQRPGSSTSTIWIAEVDPGTLAVSAVTNYEGLPTGPLNTLDITAGKFAAPGSTPNQQLAFAYAGPSGTAKVDVIDFASGPFRVSTVKTWDTGYTPGGNQFSKIILKAAPFAGFSLFDQIALLVSEDKYTQFLAVLDVQPNTLAVTKTKESSVFLRDVGVQSWKVADMTIGNFDHKNSAGKHNANMQIAIAGWSNGPKGPKFWNAYLFNVDPQQGYKIALQQQFVEQNATPQINGAPDAILTIAAADVQGRSLELGPPTKIVIHQQGGPSLVTAVPPMHVDYIAPAGGSTPTLLNLSTVEDEFSTSYQMESTSKRQLKTQTTTSYTFGLAESLGGKLTIGNPEKNHISAGLQFAAEQTFEDGVEKQNDNTSSEEFSASVQTGTSDQVWYDQSRLNIYSYPILGQTACPSTHPDNCASRDKVPLTVEFSAIDRATSATAAASQIEWYQPAWEYGNVLSYPASYAQLQTLYPDLEKLAAGITFFTDRSKLTATTTWSNGESKSESVSSARRFSEEGGVSVSGAVTVPIIPVAGLAGSFEFNVSGSQAFENLNTTTADLDESSGIVIEKPGIFKDPPRYAYSITPYIFGRTSRP